MIKLQEQKVKVKLTPNQVREIIQALKNFMFSDPTGNDQNMTNACLYTLLVNLHNKYQRNSNIAIKLRIQDAYGFLGWFCHIEHLLTPYARAVLLNMNDQLVQELSGNDIALIYRKNLSHATH